VVDAEQGEKTSIHFLSLNEGNTVVATKEALQLPASYTDEFKGSFQEAFQGTCR
jgi:hypothetical protein